MRKQSSEAGLEFLYDIHICKFSATSQLDVTGPYRF